MARVDYSGQTIDGRYQVKHLLGEGGMGCVYHGYQESLDRDVALKVLSEKLCRRIEQLLARADRALYEAKALGRNRVVLDGRPHGIRSVPAA